MVWIGFCWLLAVESCSVFSLSPFLLESTSFALCTEQSASDWLPLTVITARLITCIISLCHVQNSRIHQGAHLSAQLTLTAFTHTAALQTSHTCAPRPCRKSSIFSLSSLLLIFLHESKWGSPLQNRQLFQSTEHFSHLATRSLFFPHTASVYSRVHNFSCLPFVV